MVRTSMGVTKNLEIGGGQKYLDSLCEKFNEVVELYQTFG